MRIERMVKRVYWPGLVLLAGLLCGSAVAAQTTTAELDEIERLALAGEAEEARGRLSTWWDASFEDATRIQRQKGLWLRGLLTVDPEMAELDFQRLVVEFPGGPYTAEALVRLGGAADARGEAEVATRHFRMLVRDYPGSRYETLANAWLAENAVAAVARPAVPTPASAGVAEPAATRPATSAQPRAAPADSTVREQDDDASGATEEVGRWAVQLGAFSSESRAQSVFERAVSAGLDARLVKVTGNSLFRVRVGRLASKEEAEGLMRTVVELGLEATVVSNADQEER